MTLTPVEWIALSALVGLSLVIIGFLIASYMRSRESEERALRAEIKNIEKIMNENAREMIERWSHASSGLMKAVLELRLAINDVRAWATEQYAAKSELEAVERRSADRMKDCKAICPVRLG